MIEHAQRLVEHEDVTSVPHAPECDVKLAVREEVRADIDRRAVVSLRGNSMGGEVWSGGRKRPTVPLLVSWVLAWHGVRPLRNNTATERQVGAGRAETTGP